MLPTFYKKGVWPIILFLKLSSMTFLKMVFSHFFHPEKSALRFDAGKKCFQGEKCSALLVSIFLVLRKFIKMGGNQEEILGFSRI